MMFSNVPLRRNLAPEQVLRQCGAAVNSNRATDSSELPTAPFDRTSENVTTNQLKARTTDARSLQASPIESISPGVTVSRRGLSKWVIGAILLIIIVGIMSSVAYVRNQRHSRTGGPFSLSGSQTAGYEGDTDRRCSQTSDSFEKVVGWY